MIKEFKPDDIVKSCPYIESGVWFNIRGIACCCLSTYTSPEIITSEELNSGKVTYDLVLQRRRELFEGVNDLREMDTGSCKFCSSLKEKKYKDVNFEYLGVQELPSGFNLQFFTSCNLRCTYCIYTVQNNFVKPQYDIIPFIEMYRKRNKIKSNNWIDFNGGEPTLLENFDKILNYLLDNNIGNIGVYSNCVKYSQSIYDALKENKIYLINSIDAGTATTYQKLHGANVYNKVVENLIRYQNSGTNNLQIKYIVCDNNRTDDDLYGFLFLILAVRPGFCIISVDFPYGDKEIPIESAIFTAKMWYLLEKFGGITPMIQSDHASIGDIKFYNFSKTIREEYKKLKEKNDFEKDWDLYKIKYQKVVAPVAVTTKKPFNFSLFSVFKDEKYLTITLFGIKLTIKLNK
ncbi:radical SAM protein [Brachyspira murdochii]|uniref:radical SAM protein n=1 Tax=Brachyspira murdochii TaxID=84378 RepID=UPI0012F48BC4|nr:radical SAM protein [Brachyspira murdochii]